MTELQLKSALLTIAADEENLISLKERGMSPARFVDAVYSDALLSELNRSLRSVFVCELISQDGSSTAVMKDDLMKEYGGGRELRYGRLSRKRAACVGQEEPHTMYGDGRFIGFDDRETYINEDGEVFMLDCHVESIVQEDKASGGVQVGPHVIQRSPCCRPEAHPTLDRMVDFLPKNLRNMWPNAAIVPLSSESEDDDPALEDENDAVTCSAQECLAKKKKNPVKNEPHAPSREEIGSILWFLFH